MIKGLAVASEHEDALKETLESLVSSAEEEGRHLWATAAVVSVCDGRFINWNPMQFLNGSGVCWTHGCWTHTLVHTLKNILTRCSEPPEDWVGLEIREHRNT